MHTNQQDKLNLFEGGRDELERTDEHRNRMLGIVNEVTDKYARQLSQERSWVRRLVIRIKRDMEIRKRIRAITSSKNLHIAGHWS